MIDLLFLDIYNVSSADELRDGYVYFKDLVVPAAAIYFSIKTVYGGIKTENEINKRNSEYSEIQKQISLKEILNSTNQTLLKSIDEGTNVLKKALPTLSIESFTSYTIQDVNPTNFKVIQDFGYLNLIKLIDINNGKEREVFSKYWVAIDSIVRNFTQLNNYLKDLFDVFNKKNEKLSELNNLIAIETSNNIHREIEPFTTLAYDINQLKDKPRLKLALESAKIIDVFKSSDDKMLVKLNVFLNSLLNLRNDKITSRALTSEYLQKIEHSLAIIHDMTVILQTSKASIENYLSIFEKNRLAIEKFDEIIKNKTYELPSIKQSFTNRLFKKNKHRP